MDFCRTSGKEKGVLPVRFGQQRTLQPLEEGIVRGVNGGVASVKWISRSIHARRRQHRGRSAFLSFKMAAEFPALGKHPARLADWRHRVQPARFNAWER